MSTTRPESEKKPAEPVTSEQAKKEEEKKQKEAEEKARREKEHQSYNDFLKYALPDLKKVEDAPVYKRVGDDEKREATIAVNDELPAFTTLAKEGTYTAEGKSTLIVGADGSVRFNATSAEFAENPAKHFGDALDFLKYNGGKEVATLSYPHLKDENSRSNYIDPRHLMTFMDEAEKRGMKVEFGDEVMQRLAQARHDDQDLYHPGIYKKGIGAANYDKIMHRMQEVNAKYEAKQPATKALVDAGRLTSEMQAEPKLPATVAEKKAAIDNLFKNADGTDMTPQQQLEKAHQEMTKVETRLQRIDQAMTLLTNQETNAAKDPKLENAIYEKGKPLQAAFDAERADVQARQQLLEAKIATIPAVAPAASAPPKEGEPAKPEPKTIADVQKKVESANGLMDKMNKAQDTMQKNVADFANKMDSTDRSNNRTQQP